LKSIYTGSGKETFGVGEKLAPFLCAGDILCLNGELGAGKTKFIQGAACGLGVNEAVTSPTFTLINEYQGRLPVFHMDAYRLDSPMEMEELGCEEYFYGDGVTMVEWAEKVQAILPEERLGIYIKRLDTGENQREIILVPAGGRYRHLVEELMRVVRTGN